MKFTALPGTFEFPEYRQLYLTVKMCSSDQPLTFIDIEEEMHISHSSLELALDKISDLYSKREPYIKIIHTRGSFAFEEDELKRRKVLNLHMLSLWNYHGIGSALYSDEIFDSETSELAINAVRAALKKYGLRMQDAGVISLILSVVIAYHRVMHGHFLPQASAVVKADIAVYRAVREILGALESHYSFLFNAEEYDALYQQIRSNLFYLDPHYRSTGTTTYDTASINAASNYLRQIREYFKLDFSTDREFYMILIQYFSDIKSGAASNTQLTPEELRREYIISVPFARLFQNIAKKYLHRFLVETEIIQLASLISGVFLRHIRDSMDKRLRTVIACHMDYPTSWLLKQKIESAFGSRLYVTDVITINEKLSYDFSNVDLLLITAMLDPVKIPDMDTLQITFRLNAQDRREISHYLSHHILYKKANQDNEAIRKLISQADWLQETQFSSTDDMLHLLACRLSGTKEEQQILFNEFTMQERYTTYSVLKGIVFVYSLIPSQETRLSVIRLDNACLWGKNKVSLIIGGCFSRNEMEFIPKMCQLFYQQMRSCTEYSETKNKAEFIRLIETYQNSDTAV
ncbi:hypothetical protein BHK98_05445 [Hornefia porci]|uniref:Mga helix-turn-helix domain-containing protein n=1 Tax=Hornefia porci TaxID=2652292 RepID=A0A1Q9JH63_9FIRM|nr:hypothetical protein [Hornefia porci]OLR55553.1 hypothetical protein BHK98_05445 [Hornefia porci]